MRVVVCNPGMASWDEFSCRPCILELLFLLYREYPLQTQANVFFFLKASEGTTPTINFSRGTRIVDFARTIAWVREDEGARNRLIRAPTIFVNGLRV